MPRPASVFELRRFLRLGCPGGTKVAGLPKRRSLPILPVVRAPRSRDPGRPAAPAAKRRLSRGLSSRGVIFVGGRASKNCESALLLETRCTDRAEVRVSSVRRGPATPARENMPIRYLRFCRGEGIAGRRWCLTMAKSRALLLEKYSRWPRAAHFCQIGACAGPTHLPESARQAPGALPRARPCRSARPALPPAAPRAFRPFGSCCPASPCRPPLARGDPLPREPLSSLGLSSPPAARCAPAARRSRTQKAPPPGGGDGARGQRAVWGASGESGPAPA